MWAKMSQAQDVITSLVLQFSGLMEASPSLCPKTCRYSQVFAPEKDLTCLGL